MPGHDGRGDGEAYELSSLCDSRWHAHSHHQSNRRLRLSQLFMPIEVYKAASRYMQRPTGVNDENSDSDESTAIEEMGEEQQTRVGRDGTLDALLLRQKRKLDHKQDDHDDDNNDLEAHQPAWMRANASSDSNVLRRPLVLPTVLLLVLVLFAAYFLGDSSLKSTATSTKHAGAKKKLELDDYLLAPSGYAQST